MVLANIFRPLTDIFGPVVVLFHSIIRGSWGVVDHRADGRRPSSASATRVQADAIDAQTPTGDAADEGDLPDHRPGDAVGQSTLAPTATRHRYRSKPER